MTPSMLALVEEGGGGGAPRSQQLRNQPLAAAAAAPCFSAYSPPLPPPPAPGSTYDTIGFNVLLPTMDGATALAATFAPTSGLQGSSLLCSAAALVVANASGLPPSAFSMALSPPPSASLIDDTTQSWAAQLGAIHGRAAGVIVGALAVLLALATVAARCGGRKRGAAKAKRAELAAAAKQAALSAAANHLRAFRNRAWLSGAWNDATMREMEEAAAAEAGAIAVIEAEAAAAAAAEAAASEEAAMAEEVARRVAEALREVEAAEAAEAARVAAAAVKIQARVRGVISRRARAGGGGGGGVGAGAGGQRPTPRPAFGTPPSPKKPPQKQATLSPEQAARAEALQEKARARGLAAQAAALKAKKALG